MDPVSAEFACYGLSTRPTSLEGYESSKEHATRSKGAKDALKSCPCGTARCFQKSCPKSCPPGVSASHRDGDLHNKVLCSNPRFWHGMVIIVHGKPTGRDRFEPKSSLISRPMKPRRSQSHIPNCASCCSKSTAADTQWKIPDMCVRGCRIVSM